MNLKIKEIEAKSVLGRSGIPGATYCVNPYTGCSHACVYCYAEFMKRYTEHEEPWGTFVDVKANTPEILRKQLVRAKPGRVMLSSVTDAYQPLEAQYQITRRCLEALLEHGRAVDILTKSPLILRDLDLIRQFEDIEVGITITTDVERIRKAFEPGAPPISERVGALKALHEAGVSNYVFIGPLLPMNPEKLADMIRPYAGGFLIDRMNYVTKSVPVYRRLGMTKWLDREFVDDIKKRLRAALGKETLPLF